MPDEPNPAVDDALTPADMEVVVALQKAELDRLLRENAKLHQRVSQLLKMQEREQVLRQQMQSLMGDAAKAKTKELAPPETDDRVEAAERRYEKLKQVLTLLVAAIEKQRRD